ncbi:hypothetical protein T439DRAFT_324288, partial [Meredithblackwellia eburnea MCA 4105]
MAEATTPLASTSKLQEEERGGVEKIEKTARTRPPPPTLKQDPWTRSAVTAAFWAVALVGVPYWWNTTTIERLQLPNQRVHAWKSKSPCYLRPPVSLRVHSSAGAASAVEVQSRLAAYLPAGCLDLWVGSGDSQLTGTEYSLLLDNQNRPTSEPSTPSRAQVVGKRAISMPGQSSEEATRKAVESLLDLRPSLLDDVGHDRVVKFAPAYKLVFSLMNEDSSSGGMVGGWDIENLIKTHIQPLLTVLGPLHRFSIETQVQYFAPLSINIHLTDQGSLIDADDLRAFVNPAEWNLASSVTLDPVLNFILYVPSPSHRPLRIKTSSGAVNSANAFTSPQWGGVVIFNPESEHSADGDMNPAFRLFRHQLEALLGVPTPAALATSSKAKFRTPAQWQVDALIRRRLEEATKETVETLHSIVKLVDDLPNMRVGKEVQRGVKEALNELDTAHQILSTSPASALSHVSRAHQLASKAYFNPTMLALLYFPDEHKYAIYTPLFGPVAVPMLVSLLKEWKAWKERRRLAAGAKVKV